MTTTTTTHTKPWDLSLALEFSNSFTAPKAASLSGDDAIFTFDEETFNARAARVDSVAASDINGRDLAKQPGTLGDFAKVWQFLGAPSIDPDSTGSSASQTSYGSPNQYGYTSDDAAYTHTSKKSNTNVQFSEATDNSGEEASSLQNATSLTKNQRKKAIRKQRKLVDAQLNNNAPVSESVPDPVIKGSRARATSAHHVAHTAPTPKHSIAEIDQRPKPATTSTAELLFGHDSLMGPSATVKQAVSAVNQALAGIKQQNAPDTPSPKPRMIPLQQQMSRPAATLFQPSTKATPSQAGPRGQSTNINYTPAPNLPSSISPMANRNRPATATLPLENAKSPHPKDAISPMIHRTGEDRNLFFLVNLIDDFPEDRRYLVNPMNLTTHNDDPAGIHVFVDASNIFIGFNDQLKFTRNIPRMRHMQQADMSFDSLALLMERRRPIAKRALVGSKPYVSAFDKAKAVGYECSILDKVYKARELTDRQIYFKELERRTYGRSTKMAPPCNAVNLSAGSPASKVVNGNGSGSGSETNTPQYAKHAWVEQGVDEVLHLKMMESIVDFDEPSTMVLATGDAAQAEYSAGFLKMAQRALQKGWNVELVTWSKGINGQYKELARYWGEKFKIIFLDDYAEELLDM